MKNSVHRLLVLTCFSVASSYSICIVANPTDLMLPQPLIMTQAQTADDYNNESARPNTEPYQPEPSTTTQPSQPQASPSTTPSPPKANPSTTPSSSQVSPSTTPSPPQAKPDTQPSQPEESTEPLPISHPKMYPSVEPEFYQPQPNIQTSENQPSTQTSATQHSTDLHPKPAKNWAVKVGRFSTEKDTNKTVTLLQKHGFDGFVKEIKSNDNLVMEVYVGPTQQRSQAESLNKKLQKSHISGRVVTTEYDSTKSTNDQ